MEVTQHSSTALRLPRRIEMLVQDGAADRIRFP